MAVLAFLSIRGSILVYKRNIKVRKDSVSVYLNKQYNFEFIDSTG